MQYLQLMGIIMAFKKKDMFLEMEQYIETLLKVIKRIVTISEDADLPVEVKQLLNLKVMSVAKAKRDKMHGWKLDSDFICAYHSS